MPQTKLTEYKFQIRAGTNPAGRGLRHKCHKSLTLNTLFKRAPHLNHTSLYNSRLPSRSPGSPEKYAEGTIWPPDGMTDRSHLTPEDAETLICKGSLLFEGSACQARHTGPGNLRYFAFAGTAEGECPSLKSNHAAYGSSLVLGGEVDENQPWETLEQPSMAVCFGSIPGSITLNQYVASVGRPLKDEQSGPIIPRREMSLRNILKRLDYLQDGLDDDPVYAEEYLHTRLVYDCDATSSSSPDIERQIYVLSRTLDSPRWYDFRHIESQTTASLFHAENPKIAHIFYHQLMLSMQLLLNICEPRLNEDHQRSLLNELPERVAWSVAFAQIWRENCAMSKNRRGSEDPILGRYKVTFLRRQHQLERLLEFGRHLKWPRFSQVEESIIIDEDRITPNEKGSAQAMTWVSGLIVPGTSLSWLIMAALLAYDRDATRVSRKFIMFRPNFGFQYRGWSYWYFQCIIAKVMAAAKDVEQSTGWVGPVYFSATLASDQCVLVSQYEPPRTLSERNVLNLKAQSDVLGPPADDYPVRDYISLKLRTKAIHGIQFQRLEFRTAFRDKQTGNMLYDSCALFVFPGFFSSTIPVRLRYNVDFITAPPCHSGPHVLYNGYRYQIVPVDQIWRCNFWGGACVCPLDRKGPKCKHRIRSPDLFDEENVLVIRTSGPPDNEVFARAWCSYMGLSAVVADCKDTCVACAIRNAYAACVSIVIISTGKEPENIATNGAEDDSPRRRRHHSRSSTHWRR